jgi:hypothetical protein
MGGGGRWGRLAILGLGCRGVDGRIAPGGKISIRSEAAPGSAFPVKVTQYDPPLRLQVSGSLLELIRRSMPDRGPSFEPFAQGLKRRVETGA